MRLDHLLSMETRANAQGQALYSVGSQDQTKSFVAVAKRKLDRQKLSFLSLLSCEGSTGL